MPTVPAGAMPRARGGSADRHLAAKTTHRLRELKTLSDNHYTLRRAEFDFRRSDGRWQHAVLPEADRSYIAQVVSATWGRIPWPGSSSRRMLPSGQA